MNDIDINNVNTYPKELLNFCEQNKEILNNTFANEFFLDAETYLGKKIFNMIKEYHVIAIHASRLCNSENIYNKGLLIPNKSKRLVNMILNPIVGMIDSENFQRVKNKLIEQIKINNKYNEIWFIIGKTSDITMRNGFWMLKKYGGELLEDIFLKLKLEDFYNKEIAKIGQASAVIFRLKIKRLEKDYLKKIMAVMVEKILLSTDKHFWAESKITFNVSANDIIKIEKIDMKEVMQVE